MSLGAASPLDSSPAVAWIEVGQVPSAKPWPGGGCPGVPRMVPAAAAVEPLPYAVCGAHQAATNASHHQSTAASAPCWQPATGRRGSILPSMFDDGIDDEPMLSKHLQEVLMFDTTLGDLGEPMPRSSALFASVPGSPMSLASTPGPQQLTGNMEDWGGALMECDMEALDILHETFVKPDVVWQVTTGIEDVFAASCLGGFNSAGVLLKEPSVQLDQKPVSAACVYLPPAAQSVSGPGSQLHSKPRVAMPKEPKVDGEPAAAGALRSRSRPKPTQPQQPMPLNPSKPQRASTPAQGAVVGSLAAPDGGPASPTEEATLLPSHPLHKSWSALTAAASAASGAAEQASQGWTAYSAAASRVVSKLGLMAATPEQSTATALKQGMAKLLVSLDNKVVHCFQIIGFSRKDAVTLASGDTSQLKAPHQVPIIESVLHAKAGIVSCFCKPFIKLLKQPKAGRGLQGITSSAASSASAAASRLASPPTAAADSKGAVVASVVAATSRKLVTTLVARFEEAMQENIFRLYASIHALEGAKPSSKEKEFMAAYTGKNKRQVTDWFTNYRSRTWKPYMHQLATQVEK